MKLWFFNKLLLHNPATSTSSTCCVLKTCRLIFVLSVAPIVLPCEHGNFVKVYIRVLDATSGRETSEYLIIHMHTFNQLYSTGIMYTSSDIFDI